jgi:hypothetical protein
MLFGSGSAGLGKQRRRRNATRNAGLSASVSARALIMRVPTLGSFAQEGTSPQRKRAVNQRQCIRYQTDAVFVR